MSENESDLERVARDCRDAGDLAKGAKFLKELAITLSVAAAALETVQPSLEQGLNFYEEVQRFEAALIERALRQTGGNQSRAARLLQLKQTTLHGKIKQYGIRLVGQVYSSTESRPTQEMLTAAPRG